MFEVKHAFDMNSYYIENWQPSVKEKNKSYIGELNGKAGIIENDQAIYLPDPK